MLNERQLSQQIPRDPLVKNLTPEEKTAIKALKSNRLITIKEADKGGKVVVLDTLAYIVEAI